MDMVLVQLWLRIVSVVACIGTILMIARYDMKHGEFVTGGALAVSIFAIGGMTFLALIGMAVPYQSAFFSIAITTMVVALGRWYYGRRNYVPTDIVRTMREHLAVITARLLIMRDYAIRCTTEGPVTTELLVTITDIEKDVTMLLADISRLLREDL